MNDNGFQEIKSGENFTKEMSLTRSAEDEAGRILHRQILLMPIQCEEWMSWTYKDEDREVWIKANVSYSLFMVRVSYQEWKTTRLCMNLVGIKEGLAIFGTFTVSIHGPEVLQSPSWLHLRVFITSCWLTILMINIVAKTLRTLFELPNSQN